MLGLSKRDATPKPCEWCGAPHAVDALCAANTARMTRRRFLFLFGAGVAGAVTAANLGIDLGHLGHRPVRGALTLETLEEACRAVSSYVAHPDIIIVGPRVAEMLKQGGLVEASDYRFKGIEFATWRGHGESAFWRADIEGVSEVGRKKGGGKKC
jgi:hypothetical protein